MKVDWAHVFVTVYIAASSAFQGFLFYMIVTQQNLIDGLASNFLKLLVTLTK